MTTEELLAEWEKDSQSTLKANVHDCFSDRDAKRILTLIQALREYEKAIEKYADDKIRSFYCGDVDWNDPDGYEIIDCCYVLNGQTAKEARENVRKILEGK